MERPFSGMCRKYVQYIDRGTFDIADNPDFDSSLANSGEGRG